MSKANKNLTYTLLDLTFRFEDEGLSYPWVGLDEDGNIRMHLSEVDFNYQVEKRKAVADGEFFTVGRAGADGNDYIYLPYDFLPEWAVTAEHFDVIVQRKS